MASVWNEALGVVWNEALGADWNEALGAVWTKALGAVSNAALNAANAFEKEGEFSNGDTDIVCYSKNKNQKKQ